MSCILQATGVAGNVYEWQVPLDTAYCQVLPYPVLLPGNRKLVSFSIGLVTEDATPQISKSKRYRTKDGRAVEIYRTDAGGYNPVIGAYQSFDGKEWHAHNWTTAGVSPPPFLHLVEVPT